ncbi:unnamed protein product [Rangifer tarandus platyrhynchus]|uniref:Uncharacterized protein n=1 Tax=Rangifer tarandus platyrhynchus TaxID=3082113 RepID=A0ABN8ZQV5_RANTA|nr:unnamed protein product [Rangifer tarandus platyrhynchus]
MGPGRRGLSSAVPAARRKRSLLARHAGFQEPQRRIGSLVTSPVFCAVCERRVSVCSSIALNRCLPPSKSLNFSPFVGTLLVLVELKSSSPPVLAGGPSALELVARRPHGRPRVLSSHACAPDLYMGPS